MPIFNDTIHTEVVLVMPVQVPTIAKLGGCPGRKAKRAGEEKITKEGSKNSSKIFKKRCETEQ